MMPPVTPEQEALVELGRQRALSADPYLDQPSLLERIGGWIAERFADLVGASSDQTAEWALRVGRFLDAALPWVLALLAVLVVWVLWRRRADILTGGAGSAGGAQVDVTHLADERSASSWLAQANRLTADGDHVGAVRAAYRAIVVHLVTHDVVPATPGLTVGAHRHLVDRGDVVDILQARGFDRASDLFERAWYGNADTGTDGDDPASGAVATAVRPVAGTATAADVRIVLDAADTLGVGQ